MSSVTLPALPCPSSHLDVPGICVPAILILAPVSEYAFYKGENNILFPPIL